MNERVYSDLMKLRPTPFQVILLFSILLHGALGWWLARSDLLPGRNAAHTETPVIHVALAHALPRPEPDTPPQSETKPAQEPEKHEVPRHDRPAATAPTLDSTPPKPATKPARPMPVERPWPAPAAPAQGAQRAEQSPAPAVAEPRPADTNPLLEADYLAGLRAEIMRHHYYPRRARRRHAEGRVRVAFVLLGNGRITRTRVVEGSGSRSLDRAALRCVESVGRYRPIPPELGRKQWPLELNIDFRLED